MEVETEGDAEGDGEEEGEEKSMRERERIEEVPVQGARGRHRRLRGVRVMRVEVSNLGSA